MSAEWIALFSGWEGVMAVGKKVTAVSVTNGGTGYTAAPAVFFDGGGGVGATAVAEMSGDRVSTVRVTNGGSGFTTAPTVRFDGGGGSGAEATAAVG